MLDVIYLALTVALFALVGLIAKGAEKLSPRPRSSAPHDAVRGEQR